MFKDLENRMQKSIGALKSELASIRTGRANAALLDHVRVSYYGSEVPVSQVGNLSVPEPRMLMITPWDKSQIAVIEKAIMKSDLGLTPTSDGEVVRIMLPELTEDRRRDLVKQVKTVGEKAKVSIRNIRRDANDSVKHQVKDEGLPEDESKRLQDRVQKVTDKFIAEIDEIIEHKEAEILTV
ncbi:ribosome recycling factor [Mariprofundus sp. KV]|uniref:ribosome recycling factor n=1 Tax=Mariprofundus sp. KV TaxID=2608715 RepID=UPI0015A14042|nr:ribosome recycling factor [Mariprofundus sp. KV]NWF36447.1 ribosome recycling factor [Mariprofundus sp. KV]